MPAEDYPRYWYAWVTARYKKQFQYRLIMGPYNSKKLASIGAANRIGVDDYTNKQVVYEVIISQSMPWY